MRSIGILHKMAKVDFAHDMWRQYLTYFVPKRRFILLVVLLVMVQAAAVVTMAILVRAVFDGGVAGQDIQSIVEKGLFILALQLLAIVCALGNRLVTMNVTKSVTQRQRQDFVDWTLMSPLPRSERASLGDVHTTLIQGTEYTDMMSNVMISKVFPSLLIAVLLLVVLGYLHLTLLLLIVAAIPIALLVNVIFTRPITRRTGALRIALARFSSLMWFQLQKKTEIKALTAEKQLQWEAAERLADVQKNSAAVVIAQAVYLACYDVVTHVLQIAVLILGAYFVVTSSMSIGVLLSFYFATGLLKVHLQTISTNLVPVVRGAESLDALYRFAASRPTASYGGCRQVSFESEIRLEGVSFQYSDVPLINDFDLCLPRGHIIGLAGNNGSGKTTLVNLILGIYRPSEGRLTVDGVSYEDISLSHFRRQAGLVPQIPFVVNGTLRDNLTFGCPTRTNASQLEAICERVRLREWIAGLPDGLDTVIGDDGMLLSGGQIQRVNIARAFLRNPTLLIMDEPANHLDEIGIESIFDDLADFPQRPAVLIISHDRRVQKYCERIVDLGVNLTTLRSLHEARLAP